MIDSRPLTQRRPARPTVNPRRINLLRLSSHRLLTRVISANFLDFPSAHFDQACWEAQHHTELTGQPSVVYYRDRPNGGKDMATVYESALSGRTLSGQSEAESIDERA